MKIRPDRLGSLTRRLKRDERGATLILVAIAILPLTIAVGVSIDYARAARLQTKINAIADAASLAAVTTPMMAQRSSEACDAARRLFVSQSAGLPDLTLNDTGSDLAVSVTDNASTVPCATTRSTITAAYQRTSSVTWNGRVKNMFAGLLGIPSLAIGGTSRANAAVAPTMDFYLLLDTSGSMSFPSTSAGITKMRQVANGCAFACHSVADATAQTKSGAMASYYDVAVSYGIPLRIDDAKVAIGKLMTMVDDVPDKNDTTYRAALATFAAKDQRANNFFKMRQPLTSTLPDVATAARSASTSLYYKNQWPTKDFSNNDTDTATDDAFSRMNDNMTPQVTDPRAARIGHRQSCFLLPMACGTNFERTASRKSRSTPRGAPQSRIVESGSAFSTPNTSKARWTETPGRSRTSCLTSGRSSQP